MATKYYIDRDYSIKSGECTIADGVATISDARFCSTNSYASEAAAIVALNARIDAKIAVLDARKAELLALKQ